jgi:hypothetical protein
MSSIPNGSHWLPSPANPDGIPGGKSLILWADFSIKNNPLTIWVRGLLQRGRRDLP